MDEYDVFLRWRKTWQRVTSIQPDWFYDEMEKALYIHNPIERYQCGVIAYFPYTRTENLSATGADWVKRYATAKARFMQGEAWLKFSGAIPGPVKDIQLDVQKRDKAETEMNALLENLKGMQRAAPLAID